MIYLYSGSPGSGKSLHVAKDIYYRLNKSTRERNVIANFTINKKMLKSKKANFIYKDNEDLTVEYLVNYSIKNHTLGKENQTLVVVDECQVVWNARQWQDNKNRMDWIKFFTQHRKLGFNFIVISQNDRMIDKQIRSLFEYEVKHRKINNFKIGKLLPMSTFIAISYWYGVNERLNSEIFTYKKKWGQFYDSYGTFEIDEKIKSMINFENINENPVATVGGQGVPDSTNGFNPIIENKPKNKFFRKKQKIKKEKKLNLLENFKLEYIDIFTKKEKKIMILLICCFMFSIYKVLTV